MYSKKKKIAIIGVGLMGGSLGLALRGKYYIVGVGRDKNKLSNAKKIGAIDEYATDLIEACKNVDIVVVCTPVDLIVNTINKIVPYLKPGAIITDVGSVKGRINDEADAILDKYIKKRKLKDEKISDTPVFIGAHPMVGSEKKGVQAGSSELYKGSSVVLIKNKDISISAFNEIKSMWLKTGAKVLVLSSSEHDKIVAITSHLPHVLAYNLCKAALVSSKKHNDVSKIIAGSFKDMTRIADSDPGDWTAICMYNKDELINAIDIFIDLLNKTKSGLSKADKVKKIFMEGYSARQKLMKKNNKN